MDSSILIVDDDPGAIQVLARVLDDLGEIFVATGGDQALEVAQSCRPDLVLLDANMPGRSGFEVCAALKADPELTDIPVIFVTANSSPEFEVSGFDLGAADFIAKPVNGQLVRARVKMQLRVKRMSDDLRRLATEDSLTGVATRRRFDDLLHRELAIACRSGLPLSVLMLDIDHFKPYNDHYGHPAGDACLKAVASVLAGSCHRPSDLVARVGGEEFALLLPQTSMADSVLVAQRVLSGVAALQLPHEGLGSDARVSLSAGASVFEGRGDRQPAALGCASPDAVQAIGAELMGAADRALYEAKHQGRNRAYGLSMTPGAVARPLSEWCRPEGRRAAAA